MGWSLSLGLVFLLNVALSLSQGQRNSECPGEFCMLPGYEPRYLKPYQKFQGIDDGLVEGCGKRCSVDPECGMFSLAAGQCRLYHEDPGHHIRDFSAIDGPFEFSRACCAEQNELRRPPANFTIRAQGGSVSGRTLNNYQRYPYSNAPVFPVASTDPVRCYIAQPSRKLMCNGKSQPAIILGSGLFFQIYTGSVDFTSFVLSCDVTLQGKLVCSATTPSTPISGTENRWYTCPYNAVPGKQFLMLGLHSISVGCEAIELYTVYL